jgi:hypothetical protein
MIKWFYRNLEGVSVEMSHRVQFAGSAEEGTDGMVVNAEEGTVARASVRVDDPEGTFDVAGHRIVWAQETEAEEDDYGGVIGVWYTSVRDVVEGHPWDGVGRVWTMELDDLNTVLDRRILLGADCNRPAETDVARMQWLMATSEMNIVDTTGYLSTIAPVMMSANDYRKQKGRDVIDDCSQQSGANWHLINLGFAGNFDLWYGNAALETYESVATISNVPSDILAGSYAPASGSRNTTKLRLDPSRVFDKVVVDYKNGYVVSSRPQTAVDFAIGGRDTTMAAPNVTTAAAARARGARYLATLATEEFSISTAIIVDAADVNIIYWGQRVQVRFSWMPRGFDEFTWMRAVNRTVRPLAPAVGEIPGSYEIAMELVGDAPGSPGVACSGLTASGSFYPLGGSGNTPNPSGGNVFYWRPGITIPQVVTPGHQGIWHFPLYGAGGSGTVDQAGDCGQNRVRCLVVGDGTMVIHTSTVSSGRNLVAILCHADAGAPGGFVVDETQYEATGDDFTFNITTHGGVNCEHWVDVKDVGDICGGKWGFAGFDWTAAA